MNFQRMGHFLPVVGPLEVLSNNSVIYFPFYLHGARVRGYTISAFSIGIEAGTFNRDLRRDVSRTAAWRAGVQPVERADEGFSL